MIGGNAHAFGAPGIAWNTAMQSGAGVVRVLLPDAVKKTVKHVLPDADFAPSNPSGSYSKQALADFVSLGTWSDAVLLAGDFGRNSETAILLESFVQKYTGLLSVTQDAVDYFKATPRLLLDRDNTLISLSLAQLQKIFINYPSIIPITYSMSTQQLVEALHELTAHTQAAIIVKHNDLLFVAHTGQVVTTPYTNMPWRVIVSSRATVFWMQNPQKQLEAIVTSLIES